MWYGHSPDMDWPLRRCFNWNTMNTTHFYFDAQLPTDRILGLWKIIQLIFFLFPVLLAQVVISTQYERNTTLFFFDALSHELPTGGILGLWKKIIQVFFKINLLLFALVASEASYNHYSNSKSYFPHFAWKGSFPNDCGHIAATAVLVIGVGGGGGGEAAPHPLPPDSYERNDIPWQCQPVSLDSKRIFSKNWHHSWIFCVG